ncbi:MAG: glycoside hydrolase family 2 protein [Solirubrobacteraceae bacterium]
MELTRGWEVAPSPPGRFGTPDDSGLTELEWHTARVPGTAAAAVGADGRDFDAEDWWFRCRFLAPADWSEEPLALELDGIATVSEVYLNGELVLESSSMWAAHVVDLEGRVRAENELVIVCRALRPLLGKRRRPSARWRTRVVNEGNLRWFRTMMFGRSPGFAPGPAPVGPWRPVRLSPRPRIALLSLHPRLEGDDGILHVSAQAAEPLEAATVTLGGEREPLRPTTAGLLEAELRLGRVERWWPHTHGEPVLHEVGIELAGTRVATRRVGFRSLSWSGEVAEHGLDLQINDVPVFIRGAVWTPADLVSMAPADGDLRALLQRVRDGGMNMLRVVGTGAYEAPAFHDLCDELGILVWQDFMFANLDYPTEDPEFLDVVTREARQVLAGIAGRPSLAVVCGNSEVEQQPAMMGLDPALGRGDLWEEALPRLVSESAADCAYVRSTPCGGDLPFHPAQGVTHYFGVSGYFRPTDDARRAEVRFASECLAFANVPDEVEAPVHHPRWKLGVQRDAGTGWDLGAGWDFDDVRDYYLGSVYGVDPVQLRRSEHERYLELSRATSGEVMAEVMGEWRRTGSPCRGALVLWLKDMLPGAGLGVLDHRGLPKVAYHHLRRALAPVAVWTTDEGVGGVAVHVANDRPEPLRGCLRVALYRDHETCVAEAREELEIGPRGIAERTVEGVLGRFVDAAWAYRFGPPTADAIVVSLETRGEPRRLISQAFRFLGRRPVSREPSTRMELEASVRQNSGTIAVLSIRSRRLAHGVRLGIPGFIPEDDAFSVEPGHERTVNLRAVTPDARLAAGSITGLNLAAPVKIDVAEP